MSRIEILGVSFDNVTMDEAVSAAMGIIAEGKRGYVVTPNPEIVMAAREKNHRMRLLRMQPFTAPKSLVRSKPT